jgi:hypothetical protein
MFKNIPNYFFLLFLILPTFGISQIFYESKAWDTLNKFDTKGRKNGYWVAYLNKKIEPVDSTLACYFGFELYQNGKVLFKFNDKKWAKNLILKTDANQSEPGNPIVLNGIFEWYGTDSLIYNEEIYDYGKPSYYRAYHYTKEGVNGFNEILYYDTPYQNELGSFYYEETTENRVLTKEYFCPGRKRNKRIKVRDN